MFDTIIHTVPYAVGVCVCGGLAAYGAMKGLGALGGYDIGLSIEPVDMDLDEALDRENRFPRRRSRAERRAARKLAEAKSRARTRKYLRQAKELDSEARRQFEDAQAKKDAASYVKATQNARMSADVKRREAMVIARKRKEYQAARVEELDKIRAERKAAKAAERENGSQMVRRAVDIPQDVAEELVRDEQEETAPGGADESSILDAASRFTKEAETNPDNLSVYRVLSV